MGIESGTRFGSYEVVEQIGSGGMGEVWRATDAELNRDVALKVLPQAFLDNADRLARFKREAEILASLNHTNIATIHGLEKVDGQTVIVMELVDGPTLADRIKEGPILPDEAMGIALQVVAALEAAHGKGIVHRDLKPANVKVRDDGTVKVLDFGISKPVDPTAISGGSPVMTTPAVTQTGVILGTAAYMSPEQARGKLIDQRTDIWAFGCLLFEMLTGQPAFGGEDVMLTLARVLDRNTDFSSIPGTVSAAVRQTIALCLEKDPNSRIADIRDVRLALEGRFETGPSLVEGEKAVPSHSWTRIAGPVIALLAGVALASLTAWSLWPAQDSAITRFSVELAGPLNVGGSIALSPDGRRIVYATNGQIYSHQLDQGQATAIPGTEDGTEAFFSPEGDEIAFFTPTQLKTVGFAGEIPRVVANTPEANGLVGAWHPNGLLVFGQGGSYGLSTVPAVGGEPEPFAELGDYRDLDYPDVLPGGDWVLYTAATVDRNWSSSDIIVQNNLTGEKRTVVEGGHFARYLPTGHLVFARDATIHAVAFDPERLETLGPAVPVVQGVATNENSGHAQFAVSENGTLIYAPGTAVAGNGNQDKSLVWVDRDGNVEPLSVRPDDYSMARISPDGTIVALVVGRGTPPTDPLPDLYVFDFETENLTQLTFDSQTDDGPVWSPDGSRIYFRSRRGGEDGAAIYQIPAEGGTVERVAGSLAGGNHLPWGISADGSTLLLVDAPTLTDVNLATLDIGNGSELQTLMDEETVQFSEPSFSPNGEWMVYHEFPANDFGAAEINIRPFPNVRQQRRPVAPGLHPVFSADGSEIFFFDGGGLSVAPVEYAPFRVGNPQQLFRGQYWYGVGGPTGVFGRAWDVDPNNDRFLMITMPETAEGESREQPRPQINVILNWFDELNQLVPRE